MEISKRCIDLLQDGWKGEVNLEYYVVKGPIKLKGKFVRSICLTMLYGIECWAVKKEHAQKVNVVELRLLTWMSSNTLRDKLRNEFIQK